MPNNILLTPEQLRLKYPVVHRVFFTKGEPVPVDLKDRPGYAKFQQIGLQLKAKAELTKQADKRRLDDNEV